MQIVELITYAIPGDPYYLKDEIVLEELKKIRSSIWGKIELYWGSSTEEKVHYFIDADDSVIRAMIVIMKSIIAKEDNARDDMTVFEEVLKNNNIKYKLIDNDEPDSSFRI